MKFNITVAKIGSVFVEAESEEAAKAFASTLPDTDFQWCDTEVTDCFEDNEIPDWQCLSAEDDDDENISDDGEDSPNDCEGPQNDTPRFDPNALRGFSVSADDGHTWTEQLLTMQEAKEEVALGHLVKMRVYQICEQCGKAFPIQYFSDGTYQYCDDVGEPCDCEAEFHPLHSYDPTLSEFKAFFAKK